MKDIKSYVEEICKKTKAAQSGLSRASGAKKNAIIEDIAFSLIEHSGEIIEANKIDLEEGKKSGLSASLIDRLTLTESRIASIASAAREVIMLNDPIGGGERWVTPRGLTISKVHVPIGNVAIIYESRPNVTVDAAVICIKTGNSCVLRGGKEAINTNRILVRIMQSCLLNNGIDGAAVGFIDDTSREGSRSLMVMRGLVDVLIPRGGIELIRYVTENATVPTIETGAGNCHLFIDESADPAMALEIAVTAKLSRPSVCNAIETLLVHRNIAGEFLPAFAADKRICEKHVEIRGCSETLDILKNAASSAEALRNASDDDYYTEFNDYIIAVKVVGSTEEAIEHINKHNTAHSEAIVTRSMENAEIFKRDVEAAAVYVNASTRFTDGNEFGFGAEIGISTQKLHARGPMGLAELTTIKYLIDGSGQTR